MKGLESVFHFLKILPSFMEVKLKLSASSEKGSCFTLLIPLGNSHLSNEQMIENNEIVISKVNHPR